jgi:hypothetical protein
VQDAWRAVNQEHYASASRKMPASALLARRGSGFLPEISGASEPCIPRYGRWFRQFDISAAGQIGTPRQATRSSGVPDWWPVRMTGCDRSKAKTSALSRSRFRYLGQAGSGEFMTTGACCFRWALLFSALPALDSDGMVGIATGPVTGGSSGCRAGWRSSVKKLANAL